MIELRYTIAKLVILFVFGVVYLTTLPPFEAPDEPSHFARAFSVAEGQIFMKDHPKELVIFILETMKARLHTRKINPTDLVFIQRVEGLLDRYGNQQRIPNIAFNTAQYAPLAYIFHALAIKLVMLVDDSEKKLTHALYFCRIISLCTFLGLVALIFFLFPYIAWILFSICMAPMAISQASVVTTDWLILAAATILIATPFSKLTWLSASMMTFAASMILIVTKPPYVPLLIIPFVVYLLNRDDNGYANLYATGFTVLFAIATVSLWNYLIVANGVYEDTIRFTRLYFDPNIDPQKQLGFVFSNPVSYLRIVTQTFIAKGLLWYYQMVGVLGWLDLKLPVIVIILWGVFTIVAVTISEKSTILGSKKQRFGGFTCIISAGITIMSIVLVLYMTWVPVGSASVFLQGRYLHPVLVAILFGFLLLMPFALKPFYKLLGKWSVLTAAVVINTIGGFSTYMHFN
jgi:uncharacterized membrane protein